SEDVNVVDSKSGGTVMTVDSHVVGIVNGLRQVQTMGVETGKEPVLFVDDLVDAHVILREIVVISALAEKVTRTIYRAGRVWRVVRRQVLLRQRIDARGRNFVIGEGLTAEPPIWRSCDRRRIVNLIDGAGRQQLGEIALPLG